MALPTSGPLSIAQIEGEFGGSGAKSLSEYYSAASGVPSSGSPLSISDFYGKSNVVTFSYELIGGGGGGGHGFDGGANGSPAPNGGGSSIFIPSVISVASASGGTGGRSGYFHPATNTADKDGDASVYGPGGTRGTNTDPGYGSDAPSSSYGAGGGGGGGDLSNNKLDSTGYTGEGGGASTRVTGSHTVTSGTTISITIGSGGAGAFHGSYKGGDGAAGYATITFNGATTNFTSSGTITITG